MNKKIFFNVFLIAITVASLGLGCKKTQVQNNSNNTAVSTEEDEKTKEAYIYDQINQVIGDKELAKKMSETQPTEDTFQKEVKGIERGIMMADTSYKNDARLDDVTGGTASGLLRSVYRDGEYSLYASFAGLLEPINGDYYEGWLVRRAPFDYISVGRVDKIGGIFSNLYKSTKDFSKYDLYVLTLETNDNNPTPAKHILEGVITQIKPIKKR